MAFASPFRERYLPGVSPLHRADARVKLPAAVLMIFAISFTPAGAWGVLALLALPLPLLLALGRLHPGVALARTLLALPFLLAVVPLAFTRPGETVLTVPLTGWTASDAGIEAMATILARAWVAVAVAVILTATTPAAELVRALRFLGVPRLLAGTAFFAYRYLFVIGEEGARLLRARDSRSAALAGYNAGGTLRWRARVTGHMAGSLFLRSYERSERVYAAMQARGYDGEQRLLRPTRPRVLDIAAAAILVAYAVAVQAAAHV